MDENQGVEFVGSSKETIEAWVAEFGVADARTDLHAEEATVAHAPAHLVDGPVGILQRNSAKRGESGRVLVNDSSEELVLNRRQFGRAARRCPVTERDRNWRKHLHGNAFAIHVGNAGGGGPAPVIDATVVLSAEQQNRLGVADPLDAGPQVVRIGRVQIR